LSATEDLTCIPRRAFSAHATALAQYRALTNTTALHYIVHYIKNCINNISLAAAMLAKKIVSAKFEY